MRKLLIFLICVLVIVIGVYSINYLLNPDSLKETEPPTTKSFKDYSLFNYGDHFKTYSIGNKDRIDNLIDGVKIVFQNKTLLVNDHEIPNIQNLYDYFATYDDSLLVMAYYQGNKAYVITYNYNIDDYKVISDYNNMIIDSTDGLIFEDEGVIINYSYIKDNKYLKNNIDICEIEKDDFTANIAIEHYYDKNEKKLSKTEEIYSLNLYSYKKKYNLCI
ncbi:MAG: hypothetical protein J1F35_07810 [Erysipelotrichales bacterium]|nr:hypothetical protein [Erysipelotrichales bacterium]